MKKTLRQLFECEMSLGRQKSAEKVSHILMATYFNIFVAVIILADLQDSNQLIDFLQDDLLHRIFPKSLEKKSILFSRCRHAILIQLPHRHACSLLDTKTPPLNHWHPTLRTWGHLWMIPLKNYQTIISTNTKSQFQWFPTRVPWGVLKGC